MRKTILIVSLVLNALPAQKPWADQDVPVASAAVMPHPAAANPLMHLPGMQTPAAQNVPAELISGLTNTPNPFDSRLAGIAGQTVIAYNLSQNASVTVTIYDLLGKKVKSWQFAGAANGSRQGINTLPWDGTNEAGQKVSKGGYFAEVQVETAQSTATALLKIGVIH